MDALNREGDRRTEPTVAHDKWVEHIKKKLARGYVLIVSVTRPTANFFMTGKGYETCSYRAAQQLIKEGAVVEDGTHYLGTVYKLAS